MTAVPAGLTVRPVVPADFPLWLPLWDDYNAFYGRAGATALPLEITRTTWTRFFQEHEPVYALVAQLDGRLVGLAHYLFHRSTIRIEPVCYLQDLYTVPQLRGRGVGRALLGAFCERAAHGGASRLYWQTHETNHTARRLYDQIAERSGFIVYRRQL